MMMIIITTYTSSEFTCLRSHSNGGARVRTHAVWLPDHPTSICIDYMYKWSYKFH